MNLLNIQPAIEVVRCVGDQLKSRYASLAPMVDNDAMLVAFRELDGGAGIWRTAATGRFCVCDAIDGAVQFLRRTPHWFVSLTLIEDGAATATIVYDAMQEEMFHARPGAGAWCNGERLHVNDRQSHHGALLDSIIAAPAPVHRSLTAVFDVRGRPWQ